MCVCGLLLGRDGVIYDGRRCRRLVAVVVKGDGVGGGGEGNRVMRR